MDCRTSLTTRALTGTYAPNPKTLTYSASATPVDYMTTWLNLFTEGDAADCPVTECELMDGSCSTTPAINTNLYITAGSTAGTPWALKYMVNVEAGWTQTFCYRCIGTA